MPDWTVPLSDVRFTDDEVEAVAAAYRSGWLSQGPQVAAFERAFAEHVGARHAVAVSSGTSALALILAAARVSAGDEVVVPSLTFAATAAVVVHAGATPVFADIAGEQQPWVSEATVEAVIGPRTRAVVTVAYGGDPGDALALRRLADARGLLLIEDAAHALGASAGGQDAGTIGHAGAFSFFANKNMPLGEGGMVVTSDAELAERLRLLRSHGLTADTWARHRGERLDYDVVEPGFNYRLDEPRAALGLRLLERLAGDNARRAALAGAYTDALASTPDAVPALRSRAGVVNAWHIYPLLLAPGIDRHAFRMRLHESGVQTSVHYPPLHMTRAFADESTRLEATEAYGRRTITIPLFPHMNESQQMHVIQAFLGVLTS